MLLTFKAIGIGGSSTAEIIARGISEALVATQTGMMVAIPGLMMTHVAKRWRNEYVTFLQRLEGITLRHFRSGFDGIVRQATAKESAVATNQHSIHSLPEPQLS
jgi:biopolymer transport protein ExbB/TolQ